MRFRSLIIDYKADALRILREKRDRDPSSTSFWEADGNAPTKKKQRVLRIQLPPEGTEIPDAASSDETNTPGAILHPTTPGRVPTARTEAPTELPFWVTQTTTVNTVTPEGKNDKGSVDQADINSNEEETEEEASSQGTSDGKIDNPSVNIHERSNNEELEETNRAGIKSGSGNDENLSARAIPKKIDYRVFYECPWLLALVSSIRRRANRKRLANHPDVSSRLPFLPTDIYCRSFNDSFSPLYHTILRGAFDSYRVPKAPPVLSKANPRVYGPKRPARLRNDSQRNLGITGTTRTDAAVQPKSRRDQYTRQPPPDALVVVKNDQKKSSPPPIQDSPPARSVWETAILTAAAVYAYQQQQQQHQNRQRPEHPQQSHQSSQVIIREPPQQPEPPLQNQQPSQTVFYEHPQHKHAKEIKQPSHPQQDRQHQSQQPNQAVFREPWQETKHSGSIPVIEDQKNDFNPSPIVFHPTNDGVSSYGTLVHGEHRNPTPTHDSAKNPEHHHHHAQKQMSDFPQPELSHSEGEDQGLEPDDRPLRLPTTALPSDEGKDDVSRPRKRSRLHEKKAHLPNFLDAETFEGISDADGLEARFCSQVSNSERKEPPNLIAGEKSNQEVVQNSTKEANSYSNRGNTLHCSDKDYFADNDRSSHGSEPKPDAVPTTSECQLDRCKRKERMLLQRFGLLPSAMKDKNAASPSLASSSKSNSEDIQTTEIPIDPPIDHPSSPESVDCHLFSSKVQDGQREGFENHGVPDCSGQTDIKNTPSIDYASPVEFPVCFDNYDDDDDDSGLDGKDCETQKAPVTTIVIPHASPFRRTADPEECLSPKEKPNRPPKRKRSLNEKKLERYKKRRRRRKKKKKFRAERESSDFVASDSVDADHNRDGPKTPKKSDMQDDGDNGNDEKLETPRKLEFKDFSSIGIAGNEKHTKESNPETYPSERKFKSSIADENDSIWNHPLNREKSQTTLTELQLLTPHTKGGDNEKNDLGIPRKLDFDVFTPVRNDKHGQESTDAIVPRPNLDRKIDLNPSAIERVFQDNHSSKDESPKSPRLERKVSGLNDGIVLEPDDPFFVSPEEMEESTTSCTDAVVDQKEETTTHLLCSEVFFEAFGEVIAEVVRGGDNPTGSMRAASSARSIRFTDTNLVDACSVDIELPSRGAMVVASLSQIQKSPGELLGRFLPRLVEVTASDRYARLVVLVCVDVELDAQVVRDLILLQTSFLSCDRGTPKTHTSIEMASRKTLATFIVQTVARFADDELPCNISSPPNADRWLSDPQTCQRLGFLISVLPTLSVSAALYWLHMCLGGPDSSRKLPAKQRSPLVEQQEANQSAAWFHQCFENVDEECHRLESWLQLPMKTNNSCSRQTAGLQNSMNPSVPKQLIIVVNVLLNRT